MAFKFTDQHAMSLVLPHLFPGEQVLHRTRGVERPWYSKIFYRFGSLFWRYYLVVATNQRILFVQHATLLGGYKSKKVDALAWQEVQQTSLGWGIFNKTLRVRAGRASKNVDIGRFWMKGNFDAANGVVSAFTQSRTQLGSVRPPAQLGYAAA